MNRIGVGDWKCSKREREYVNDVLDSGRLSYGKYSKVLEDEFSRLHGAKFGVLSNSGTSSLQVALQAMKEVHKWRDWDEVIVPATTFVATVNIVIHNRMTPVLVDVDPFSYNMDVGQARKAITERTRAVIPVHLFGQAADMRLFEGFPPYIKIIEDACEAAFADINGKMVGSFGDIGCFSFYVAHHLTTGVGGISITSEPVYAEKMRSLVNHGRDGIYIHMDTNATEEVIQRRFNFQSIGHSYRITELEAAIGLAQLADWKKMIKRRRAIAGHYTNKLSEIGQLVLPVTQRGFGHSWMMYPIIVKDEDKWGLVNHLEARGIETREMLPLLNQPCYRGIWKPEDYPVSNMILKSGFYIGCHQGITTREQDYVIRVIEEYFK